MLTFKRTILSASLVLLLTAGLTGCAASSDSTQVPSLVPAATAEVPATEAPVEAPAVVLDPVAQAAVDSGLTAEVYAEVTAKTVEVGLQITEKDAYLAALEALSAEYGKPIAIIENHPCYNVAGTQWGISGALIGGGTVGCAQGFSENRDTALAEIEKRAERKGWGPGDYILIIVG